MDFHCHQDLSSEGTLCKSTTPNHYRKDPLSIVMVGLSLYDLLMHHLILVIGMWFEWWTGDTNIWWYNFWSGFGSDLTEWITLGAGFGLLYKHLNCHTDTCRRLAFRHIVDPDSGEHLRLCHKHHPRKSITPEYIADVTQRIEAQRQN